MHSPGTGSWLPVASSADLPTGVVMPVRMPDGPVALWRSSSGQPAAFADRCPHRGMRLSHGFVRGETLSCIYHGWRYGETGACLKIPAHPHLMPPKAIYAKTRRVIETGGLIWIALDEDAPAPALPGGFEALRSLTADAKPEAVEAVSGAMRDAMGLLLPASEELVVRFLLAAQAKTQTLIHVLVPAGADFASRLAASRAAEMLRRDAEAIEARGGIS